MEQKSANNVSAEVLAAFLDGNATAKESNEIMRALASDAEMMEILRISQSVDAELGVMPFECEVIPATAMAATCNEECYCSLECEKYILRRLDIEFDEQKLLENALLNGWQKENGTALHNIGRHLESKGLIVSRQYKSTMDDIINALNVNEQVIVAVDGGELSGRGLDEVVEDMFIGHIPDHTIVVLSYDSERGTIAIYDPNSSNQEDVYPIDVFKGAWDDSKNYMVTVSADITKKYVPRPIDLSDVELAEDLNELRESIAENAHDVWALERQAQGWTYGPRRDDSKKETPCMVSYSQLPESEKKFDRDMAMNTLKLVKKLGYDMIKRKDTELYKTLFNRIQSADDGLLCPHCLSTGVRTPVCRCDVFCSQCGNKIENE